MLVLLIEDDEVDQLAFVRSIKTTSFRYFIAETVERAKQLLTSEKFDIIISDYQLADGTVMDIFNMHLPIPVIITTGAGTEETALHALKAGAADYLIKDIDRTYLLFLPSIIEKVHRQQKNDRQAKILNQAIKTISHGICISDEKKNIVFVNPSFCRLFEYEEVNLIGQPEEPLLKEIESLKLMTTPLDDGLDQILFSRKDGTTFSSSYTCAAIKDGQDEKIGTVRVFRDITAFIKLEEKVRAEAEELARAKAELKQIELFAFVSTHDLQEPLHKIITFGSLFIADPSVTMNDTARYYLTNITSTVEEMRQMISQLHNYSTIMTEGVQFSRVNLNIVIQEVLKKLQNEIDSSQANVKIEKLPTINADQKQMYKLFLNLIHNALRFRNKTIPTEIAIRCRETTDTIEIDIEDNGIGFDEKFLHRLFKPFQRLHSSKEYKGRGLGLAICEKIVMRHSGSIRAKSTISKGSTFTVTLPKFAKNP